MNYIANSKNRKLKNKIHSILHRLSFNFFHLSMGRKIIGVGTFISFVSLFFRWFTLPDSSFQNNAFSLQVGYSGYVILILLAIITLLLLSDQAKETGKSRIPTIFSDHSAILFSGVAIFLITFVAFNAMRGFVLLYQNFTIGKGSIFEFIGAIFIVLGGFAYYREKRRDIQSLIYVENSQASVSILDEYQDILGKNDPNKENMSLPV